MKRRGYAPDPWLLSLALQLLALVFLVAAGILIASTAFGQEPKDPRPLLTVEALAKVQPSEEPPGAWLGALYRRADGQPVFFFRQEEGDVCLLGRKYLPATNLPPDGLSWPFVTEPWVDSLPVHPVPWGVWRLPDLPVWYVHPGETPLPLTGPAVIQPAFLRWGPPITLRIGAPLILR